MSVARLHAFFSGRVQGVGFRYTARRIADGFPVNGWARNLDDGRVELVAEGKRENLERFLEAVQREFSGFILRTGTAWETPTGEYTAFTITH